MHRDPSTPPQGPSSLLARGTDRVRRFVLDDGSRFQQFFTISQTLAVRPRASVSGPGHSGTKPFIAISSGNAVASTSWKGTFSVNSYREFYSAITRLVLRARTSKAVIPNAYTSLSRELPPVPLNRSGNISSGASQRGFPQDCDIEHCDIEPANDWSEKVPQ